MKFLIVEHSQVLILIPFGPKYYYYYIGITYLGKYKFSRHPRERQQMSIHVRAHCVWVYVGVSLNCEVVAFCLEECTLPPGGRNL